MVTEGALDLKSLGVRGELQDVLASLRTIYQIES